jgi:hypothetical protein
VVGLKVVVTKALRLKLPGQITRANHSGMLSNLISEIRLLEIICGGNPGPARAGPRSTDSISWHRVVDPARDRRAGRVRLEISKFKQDSLSAQSPPSTVPRLCTFRHQPWGPITFSKGHQLRILQRLKLGSQMPSPSLGPRLQNSDREYGRSLASTE